MDSLSIKWHYIGLIQLLFSRVAQYTNPCKQKTAASSRPIYETLTNFVKVIDEEVNGFKCLQVIVSQLNDIIPKEGTSRLYLFSWQGIVRLVKCCLSRNRSSATSQVEARPPMIGHHLQRDLPVFHGRLSILCDVLYGLIQNFKIKVKYMSRILRYFPTLF